MKINGKILRGLVAFLLLACVLLTAVACGSEAGKTENDDPAKKEDPKEEEKEPYVPENSKYHSSDLWAFKENDKTEKVDTFFVAPTAVAGDFTNMPLDNADLKAKFKIQVENQKGIYDSNGAIRFFSPYYAQATLATYALPEAEKDASLAVAYADVKEAFEYYLNVYNGGRGIILAGSSQGADMILRLVKDFFADEKSAEKLICVYAIGWKVTDEYLQSLSAVHFATGEDDLRSIVSFNSESAEITESMIVGANEKTHAINPLNWSTGTETAAKELNLGCCMFSTKGGQKGDDMVGFCGAYIDTVRGTLKVTDVPDPEKTLYPSRLDGQPYGVFHIYDWEFFYRNLEKNVDTRAGAYLAKTAD